MRVSRAISANPEKGKPLGRMLPVWAQGVACGSYRSNRVHTICQFEDLAQAANMNVYSSGFDINIMSPNRVQQLLSGKNLTRAAHEMLQQAELCGA
jgi:hypothetical protein